MEYHVGKDNHIFTDTEQRIDVWGTIFIVPVIEIWHQQSQRDVDFQHTFLDF